MLTSLRSLLTLCRSGSWGEPPGYCPSASFTRLPRRLPHHRLAAAQICWGRGLFVGWKTAAAAARTAARPVYLKPACCAWVELSSLLVSRGGGGSRRPGCCRPAHLLELHGECDVFSPATSMGHDWASPGQVQRRELVEKWN